MQSTHSTVIAVTTRLRERSRPTRAQYLERVRRAADTAPVRERMGCANLAHALAGCEADDKRRLRRGGAPNLAIITAYNDMLSAHKPYEHYPERLRSAARIRGATAQVAGGVPAMCDGITQGERGMELSLFSRDIIAMSAAVALSHEVYDGALYLGICDKIVPGLLIGALSYGHLPALFVPSGPMPSGMSNAEKVKFRQRAAEGQVSRDELLEAETKSYHSAGTCTFYGTANSNQMLVELMGLQLPGSSFVPPGSPLREALTDHAVAQLLSLTARGERYLPIAQIVDERAIVNAVVGLHATGGSTNHLLHLIAIARAAGIVLELDDFAALADAVPLLARIYPNGSADVNQFHASGGMRVLIAELLDGGLLHADVDTVAGPGLARYCEEPALDGMQLRYESRERRSGDVSVLRSVRDPFASSGSLRVLRGTLGTAAAKLSAVPPERCAITAPARVFDDQRSFKAAFERGELYRDFIAVVRFQGPRANGMPEMHSLMPILGLLQDRGHRVALVTDGRLSGASGKVLSAIHVTPEARFGGALARLCDGDVLAVDATTGQFDVLMDMTEFAARPTHSPENIDMTPVQELFSVLRGSVGDATRGASIFGVPV